MLAGAFSDFFQSEETRVRRRMWRDAATLDDSKTRRILSV
jgi:hypothetical protein